MGTRQSLRISSVVLSPSAPSTQQSRRPHPSPPLPPHPPPPQVAAPHHHLLPPSLPLPQSPLLLLLLRKRTQGLRSSTGRSTRNTQQLVLEPMEPRGRSTSQRRQLGR